jgi:hypothetical protein
VSDVPGATSYRWTRNGEIVGETTDGTLGIGWRKAKEPDVKIPKSQNLKIPKSKNGIIFSAAGGVAGAEHGTIQLETNRWRANAASAAASSSPR